MKPIYAVWIRNDFRLHNHAAIYHALKRAEEKGGEIILFFHIHPAFLKEIDIHHDYFFQSLETFRLACAQKYNLHLHLLHGNFTDAFQPIIQHSSIKEIYHAKDYTPFAKDRDQQVKELLTEAGISLYACKGNYILDPEDVVKQDGTPYKVFTPYYRQWSKTAKSSLLAIEQKQFQHFTANLAPLNIDAENFFIKQVLSHCTMTWEGLGEDEAISRLERFLDERLTTYHDYRDFPAHIGTSRLSPYIKTGALSIQTIHQMVMTRLDNSGKGAETFLKELAWRDFYAMIYHFHPYLKKKEFNTSYRNIAWENNDALLKKWQDGETGFPIVDAAMKQLNSIGWMHNRLRMVTASFLTKDYQIDWRLGESYFEKKLIDYDEASNIGGWQWAASVGTDAVPYFRVFNPTRQSERFDPNGQFIKAFLPKLKDVPVTSIHAPEKMTKQIQENTNCVLGEDYPFPTVDHAIQRKKAISLFKGDENE